MITIFTRGVCLFVRMSTLFKISQNKINLSISPHFSKSSKTKQSSIVNTVVFATGEEDVL